MRGAASALRKHHGEWRTESARGWAAGAQAPPGAARTQKERLGEWGKNQDDSAAGSGVNPVALSIRKTWAGPRQALGSRPRECLGIPREGPGQSPQERPGSPRG